MTQTTLRLDVHSNMDALGFLARESLFGNIQLAIATATALIGLVEKFGKKVTVREMIGAGIRGEKLVVIGAIRRNFSF